MTRPKRGVFTAVAGAALFAGTFGMDLAARPQNAVPKAAAPSFEVASVKRSPPLNANGAISIMTGRLQGNRWTADGVTLLMLIRSAYAPRYQVQGQIVGGPAWLQTDRFIVNAKAEGTPTMDEARVMLQQFLADRFKLVVHRETRELPVFALVLARSDGRLGRDMRPAGVDCDALRDAQKEAGPPRALASNPDAPPPCYMRMMMGQVTRLQSGGSTSAELASMLSQSAGRPVIDRTGLSGYFSFTVEFAREPGATSPLGPLPPDPFAGNNATTNDTASIFAAVQEQLGLKLESRLESAEVLVIDGVEQPAED